MSRHNLIICYKPIDVYAFVLRDSHAYKRLKNGLFKFTGKLCNSHPRYLMRIKLASQSINLYSKREIFVF
jgi:hypothetical protein